MTAPPGAWFLALFLLAGAAFGTFHALVVPVGRPADELAHLQRIEMLSRGQWFAERRLDDSPAGLMLAGSATPLAFVRIAALTAPIDGRPPADAIDMARRVDWSEGRRFWPFSNTVIYPPPLYLPATLAYRALAGSATPYQTAIAIRFANLAAFLILGTIALAVAGAARPLIFTVLTLPMSLALAASASQDGPMIAAAAIAATLLAAPTDRRRPARLVGATLLLAAVIAARPVYAPLALLLFRHNGLGAIGFAAVAALSGLWVVAVAKGGIAPLLAGVDPAAQVQAALRDPTLLPTAAVNAVRAGLWYWGEGTIGVFGHLDIHLSKAAYLAYGAIVLAATLAAGGIALPGLTVMAAAVALILIAQFLTWTPVGQRVVDGVQGRYFLPLIPFVGAGGRAWPKPGRWPAATAWLILLAPLMGLPYAARVLWQAYIP